MGQSLRRSPEWKPGAGCFKALWSTGTLLMAACMVVPRTNESGEGNQKLHLPLREELTDTLQQAVENLSQKDRTVFKDS